MRTISGEAKRIALLRLWASVGRELAAINILAALAEC